MMKEESRRRRAQTLVRAWSGRAFLTEVCARCCQQVLEEVRETRRRRRITATTRHSNDSTLLEWSDVACYRNL